MTSMTGQETTYSKAARHFHWWTVLLVAIQVPVGLYMVYRAGVTNFDAVTNTLYSSHKSLGLLILALVASRLVYRLRHGAPRDEPTLTLFEKAASHATHWGLYLLLLVVPVVGWIGISMYPALNVFGIVDIPALASPDTDTANRVFMLHKYLAYLVVALVGMHVAGALFHYVIRKDGVLARMLPRAGKRS